MTSTPANLTWEEFLKDIRWHLEHENIKDFLNWNAIRQSMHVNDRPHIPLLDYFESNICKFTDLEEIFEFGGGHGRICRMIKDRGFIGKYTIFDFPEMAVLQQYYLKDYGNIHYMNDLEHLQKTNSCKSLFISMSALEESPKEVQAIFFPYAKQYDNFLFKYSGGKGEF